MKLVILDRDGTINHDSPNYIKSPEEWHPIGGSLEALARLVQGGFKVAVATNQAAISRGLFDMATLNAIHKKMHDAAAEMGGNIDSINVCPHAPEDLCECRKPKPGLLIEIGRRYGVSLNGVDMVGDTRRDLEAAVAAGARPVLVLTGYGRKTCEDGNLPAGTRIFPDLAAYAMHLVP